MTVERISYQSDGRAMESDLFLPSDSGPFPGVLVFPEAFGLGDHARGRARRLSELGYAALACDLHGGGEVIDDIEKLMPIFGPLADDQTRIRRRAADCLAILTGRSEIDGARVAAIGYCFGGTMALELARSGAPIRGAAGFHSGLSTRTPGDAASFKGRILVCIGADDPSIDADQRRAFEEEMRAAGVDWRMILYGNVVHSFTNPEADQRNMPGFARHDPAASEHSWGELVGFLSEVLA